MFSPALVNKPATCVSIDADMVGSFIRINSQESARGWLTVAPELKRLNTMPQSDGKLLVADAAYSSRVRSAHGFNAHVRVYPPSRPHCHVYVANWIPSTPFFFLQGGGGSGGAAGGLKFTVADTCERIKEEFNFIQQQYHSWVSLFLSSLIFLLAFSSLLFAPVSSRTFLFFFSSFFSLSSVCPGVFPRIFTIIQDDGFSSAFFLVLSRPTFDNAAIIDRFAPFDACFIPTVKNGYLVMHFLI